MFQFDTLPIPSHKQQNKIMSYLLALNILDNFENSVQSPRWRFAMDVYTFSEAAFLHSTYYRVEGERLSLSVAATACYGSVLSGRRPQDCCISTRFHHVPSNYGLCNTSWHIYLYYNPFKT